MSRTKSATNERRAESLTLFGLPKRRLGYLPLVCRGREGGFLFQLGCGSIHGLHVVPGGALAASHLAPAKHMRHGRTLCPEYSMPPTNSPAQKPNDVPKPAENPKKDR